MNNHFIKFAFVYFYSIILKKLKMCRGTKVPLRRGAISTPVGKRHFFKENKEMKVFFPVTYTLITSRNLVPLSLIFFKV